MAEGVVFAPAEPQEQPGRQPWRPPAIGLRFVAIGEDRVEDMRAKAGLGGVAAGAVAITEQRVQPAVAAAAASEIVDQLDMPGRIAERLGGVIERQRRRMAARQTAERQPRDLMAI